MAMAESNEVDIIETLMTSSRDWVQLTRVSEAMTRAVQFLQDTFEIQLGFVMYQRMPTVDTLTTTHPAIRWFRSWGFHTSDTILQQTVHSTLSFSGQLRLRSWFSPQELPREWQLIFADHGVQQVGVWMVSFHGEPTGVLVLGRKVMAPPTDARTISICMSHISVVIESILLRRIYELSSLRDPLTNVFNRRGFMQEFERRMSETSAQSTWVLAVVDIDNFKTINDTHGHLEGDKVLRSIAQVLDEHVRRQYGGICARFGGDEFVLLAEAYAPESLLSATEVATWCLETGVEASVGCAIVGEDGHDFDTCFHIADTRLYGYRTNQCSSSGDDPH